MARPATPKLSKEKTLISEVLQRVSNAKTKDQKIKILKEYDTMALQKVLLCNFSYDIKFVFPDGQSPYKKPEEGEEQPVGYDHVWLISEHRQIDKFTKKAWNNQVFYGDSGTTQPTIPQLRKEQLWVQLLESLHPNEAEVLDLVKDKKLQTRYKITKQNVIDAFPQLGIS
jgi:hypothetical protein